MYTFLYTMMLNTSVSFLVILCVFAASSAQDYCYRDRESCTDQYEQIPEDPYLSTCENITYNISEGLCCNDVLIRGLSKLVADCCESQAFNPLNEMCCNGRILIRTHLNEKCCGSETYLKKTHVCCGNTKVKRPDQSSVEPLCGNISSAASNNHGADKDGKENKSPGCGCTKAKEMHTSTKVSVLKCGSRPYDPLTQMCCSGTLYKSSALFKCCGAKTYRLSGKMLCCNGILYDNLPENSQCVGGFIYTVNQTIMTCGSNVINITEVGGKAECCGTLLVRKNQTCCSSSSHSMLYNNKSDHHCCGHQYYNISLWGCCAGHLTPTPNKDKSSTEYRLKPLTHLIPEMCNKTVVFGKVESVALQNLVNRTIWLRVVKEVSLSHCKSLHSVSLDHCRSPALEIGETYLWKINGKKYEPLSLPIGQVSDIHMFFTLCNKVNETICGV